jgi:hypothetical protein
MGRRFKRSTGNWRQYRQLPNATEIDVRYDSHDSEQLAAVRGVALEALKAAQAAGKDYVLFRHGTSAFSHGAASARSQLRGLMRSVEATPYIVRSGCVQHDSFFVARVKPRTSA